MPEGMKENSPEGLKEVLAYISEREGKLSNYSDRLRQAVKRIEDVFGNSKFCQICGTGSSGYMPYDHERDHPDHAFLPKIFVSLDIEDAEPFFTDDDENGPFSYLLALSDCDLVVWKRLKEDTVMPYCAKWEVSESSRKILKELVRSGRIPKFLRLVAERLEQTGKEYGEVAEVAEKMAAAI